MENLLLLLVRPHLPRCAPIYMTSDSDTAKNGGIFPPDLKIIVDQPESRTTWLNHGGNVFSEKHASTLDSFLLNPLIIMSDLDTWVDITVVDMDTLVAPDMVVATDTAEHGSGGDGY